MVFFNVCLNYLRVHEALESTNNQADTGHGGNLE